jgi:hypothetical protein
MSKEIWKDIPNYEGYYQASTVGSVRSLDRVSIRCGIKMNMTGKIIKQKEDSTKYYKVGLYKKGKRTTRQTHSLVLETFLGKIPKGLEINHKNGNTRDNRVENLEYVTHQYNMHHASINNLMNTDSRNCKKVMMLSLNNEPLLWFDSIKEASEMSGANNSSISQCCNNTRKTAGNYKWRFKV